MTLGVLKLWGKNLCLFVTKVTGYSSRYTRAGLSRTHLILFFNNDATTDDEVERKA